jgi:hypothetical protein
VAYAKGPCQVMQQSLKFNSMITAPSNISELSLMLANDAQAETIAFSNLEQRGLKLANSGLNKAFALATDVILDQRTLAQYLNTLDLAKATGASTMLGNATSNLDSALSSIGLQFCSIGQIP